MVREEGKLISWHLRLMILRMERLLDETAVDFV